MVGDILQPTHLLLVLVVALLVLGPKRLPEVGRQLGNGLRDFRSAINGERTEHVEPPAEQYEPPEPAPEFGQEPLETVVGHEPGEPSLGHEFSHEASERTPESHEFAHDGPRATVADHAAETSGSTGEHEFAYEGSEPAEKRVDPLG